MKAFMTSIAIAAEQVLPDTLERRRKQDCDPELQRLINIRKEIVKRGDDDEHVKDITKIIKKTARRIRAKRFINGFKED